MIRCPEEFTNAVFDDNIGGRDGRELGTHS